MSEAPGGIPRELQGLRCDVMRRDATSGEDQPSESPSGSCGTGGPYPTSHGLVLGA